MCKTKPNPRPVSLASLRGLSSPAITIADLVRVLVSNDEPWSARLARLAELGVDLSPARARELASRLHRFGVSVYRGHVVPLSEWLAAQEASPTLVEQTGFDPEHWALAPCQSGYVTDADGKRRRVGLMAREASPEPQAVARLLASAMPAWGAMRPPQSSSGAYCLCLADFQTGKAGEARGGTTELVQRVRSIVEQARQEVAAEKPAEVFIFELGDVCENNANHTSQSQLAANDLSLAEQLEVCARLLLEAVVALAPLVPSLTLVCVRSNHGEERRGGQTVGRGDFGILVGRVIGLALELAGAEWASRVHVVPQNALETGVGVRVEGVSVAAFHGHYAKGERNIPVWLAQQAGGYGDGAGSCFRQAQVVLHGHFHHFAVEQSRGRLIVGCPSLEAGSAWVERAQGEYGEPGAVVLRINSGRIRGLELLTPTAGMEVDRADPHACKNVY